MIVENGLSKNDYYEREIYGLPPIESGFLQHIFLNGIFHLKNCRFLQAVQHIWFENCPEGEAILLCISFECIAKLFLLAGIKGGSRDIINYYSSP